MCNFKENIKIYSLLEWQLYYYVIQKTIENTSTVFINTRLKPCKILKSIN